MSTSYYVRYNNCDACKRYDEVKIAQFSAGWAPMVFQFEARTTWKGWKDWIDYLSSKGDIPFIFDEYDRLVMLSDFVHMVEHGIGQKHHMHYPEDGVQDPDFPWVTIMNKDR